MKNWNKIVLVFVLLALIHLILETTPGIQSDYQALLFIADGVITLVFMADLFLKIKEALKEFKQKKDTDLFFNSGMLIDVLSVLPFFITLFFPAYKILTVLRLLRLLRIFKLLNLVKSNSLIINAIKNKRYELYVSMQVVLIITIILSSVLYFVENQSQPENFSSIADAFLWSVSKFIGGIGGYGDFAPVTISGKILATFVGILGIALFAVPAGIIASGFVEEIEQVKQMEELNDIYDKICNAFHFDILAGQRAKLRLGLPGLRRRFVTLTDATIKLNTSETTLFNVCSLGRNLKLAKRLKSLSAEEEILLEYFTNNSEYGTFTKRNSNITIVSPHSDDGFNLGHYSYALAEYLNANYLSVEKFGMYSFVEEKNINFSENEEFLAEEISNEVLKAFCRDLRTVARPDSFVFFIGTSMGKSEDYHILTGAKKGFDGIRPDGSFPAVEKAEAFLQSFREKQTLGQLTVTTHSAYATDMPDHISWYVRNHLKANAMALKVNVEIVKGGHDNYYDSVGILGSALKSAFAG